jgi:hypothetical protein
MSAAGDVVTWNMVGQGGTTEISRLFIGDTSQNDVKEYGSSAGLLCFLFCVKDSLSPASIIMAAAAYLLLIILGCFRVLLLLPSVRNGVQPFDGMPIVERPVWNANLIAYT